MNIIITGSSGLIGSEAARHFGKPGHNIIGVDNNQRREFFGEAGDTSWNLTLLRKSVPSFTHHDLDILCWEGISALFRETKPALVIHCAAQPSHDRAGQIPMVDFKVNAVGTMNLLEATRQHAPKAVFIMMSTNKVYGDAPNEKPLKELHERYDYADPSDYNGIDETCRIDRSLHSIFGASKVAADVMAQEYGRYYGLKTGIFRGGCLTGPAHSGVELHGFLSYLVKAAMTGQPYTVYGYKAKQVRDNLHSHDVARAMEEFAANPRPGEVYNLGGGRGNSLSVREAIHRVEAMTGKVLHWTYDEHNRKGDHICYITDLRKFQGHYPGWGVTHGIDDILHGLVESLDFRLKTKT